MRGLRSSSYSAPWFPLAPLCPARPDPDVCCLSELLPDSCKGGMCEKAEPSRY